MNFVWLDRNAEYRKEVVCPQCRTTVSGVLNNCVSAVLMCLSPTRGYAARRTDHLGPWPAERIANYYLMVLDRYLVIHWSTHWCWSCRATKFYMHIGGDLPVASRFFVPKQFVAIWKKWHLYKKSLPYLDRFAIETADPPAATPVHVFKLSKIDRSTFP